MTGNDSPGGVGGDAAPGTDRRTFLRSVAVAGVVGAGLARPASAGHAGVIEDFENGADRWTLGGRDSTDRAEYSITTTDVHVYQGEQALQYEGDTEQVLVSDGSLDAPVRGDTFNWRWFPAPGDSGAVFGFGVQSADFERGYEIELRHGDREPFGHTIALRVRSSGSGDPVTLDQTEFATTEHTQQWLRWRVEWGDPTITVRVLDDTGFPLAAVTGDDRTYDAGRLALSGDAPVENQSYFDAWQYVDRVLDPDGDGRPVTDPDGDGRYEDVDGDGDYDIFDVETFFDDVTGDGETVGHEEFDFDGDDEVDIFDVLKLFRDV